MKTRKDYMENKITHEEYYNQFVDNYIKETVIRAVGLQRIKASTCPHFNDIPLSVWDGIRGIRTPRVIKALKEAGDINADTLANQVCIAKQAARIIRSES